MHRLRKKKRPADAAQGGPVSATRWHALSSAPTRLLRICSSNCGAIATLSRFLHNATLTGRLLGHIPAHSNELGACHDN
jgi:hypothetical protein